MNPEDIARKVAKAHGIEPPELDEGDATAEEKGETAAVSKLLEGIDFYAGEAQKPISVPDGYVAPDFTQVMIGWRAWDIVGKGANTRLQSVSHSNIWVPREPMVAKCGRGTLCKSSTTDTTVMVPGETCRCGLYSAKTLPHLQTMGYSNFNIDFTKVVVGPVALWGKVIEGTQGWRAQKAYPQKFLVPFSIYELAEDLPEVYGVECELYNWTGTTFLNKPKGV